MIHRWTMLYRKRDWMNERTNYMNESSCQTARQELNLDFERWNPPLVKVRMCKILWIRLRNSINLNISMTGLFWPHPIHSLWQIFRSILEKKIIAYRVWSRCTFLYIMSLCALNGVGRVSCQKIMGGWKIRRRGTSNNNSMDTYSSAIEVSIVSPPRNLQRKS